ncbi:MAG TPA: CHASE2 domain-containing protein, partial [Nitrosomonas sp.]|nr:CHASE2 domain-containing protein [Nitrosomonas sp.]
MQKYGYGKKLLISFFIGLIGVVLYLLPFGLALDEKFGLNVLFHLRGVTSVPSDVVVIAIDQYSASKLKDNNQIANNTIDPSKWPRALHAELIDRLIEEEVKVIAFDLRFRGCGSSFEDNDRLVQAIKNAGNVILVEELVDSRDIADFPYQMDEQPEVCNSESLSTKDLNRDEPHQYYFSESVGLHGAWHRSVLPMISDAAQATAPFVLPRGVVAYHWTFKEDAGGIPLLPAVVLQIFAQDVYDQFAHILQEIDPVAGLNLPSTLDKGIEIEALMYELRGQFIEKPALKDQFINALNQNDEIDTQTKGKLQALAELYAGHEKHYLNFYGPPRSIRTIPYYQILNQDRLQDQRVDLRGKAVFVGVSAAKFGEQDKLRDDYTTVFKQ